MRELTLRLQAQLDAHDAAGWYENQRFGLGMRFLDELVNRIRVSPFQFPEIHPGVKRGLLGRFTQCISPWVRRVLR
jgi:hypothetical protein